ncbi:MAG: HDOD domain-containing protein [Gammaproteobacteria bacterium]|nr:HDOD domain-containing protein [Gammaproteobacteria bacterium]
MNTSGIYSKIYIALASDETMLPALPEIIVSLRQKLNDPNCTIKIAADVLRADPGLSAYIMRISNSVRYLFGSPPRDLEAAVMRIGLASTTSLATAYAIKAMFRSNNSKIRKLMIDSYRNATRISILSQLLAEKLPGYDADKAMLAGLLQDIAIPPILIQLSDRPEIFNDAIKRQQCIDELAPKVNALILKQWGFDDKFIDTIRARKQWDRNKQGKLDIADIVLIARWYSMMGTPAFSQCPPFEDIPALQKLPKDELNADQTLKILEDSRQQILEMEKTLQIAA